VLVGNDGASETYVGAKVKACAEIGYKSTLLRLEADVSENRLLNVIDELNNNADIDGILVQLPLPRHISDEKVINAIHPSKDVDGFHPVNVGKMVQGLPTFISATPTASSCCSNTIRSIPAACMPL
jgi:methylenetetrahydrofolate dehydrogenase (NADP+)/methenyltetrahydrofolate cyclohydrolase